MITIYGTQNCTYCQKAKWICRQYKLGFVYIPLDQESFPEHREEFKKLFPDAKTVPQILWDGKHIGGYTELVTEIENLGLGNYGQGAF